MSTTSKVTTTQDEEKQPRVARGPKPAEDVMYDRLISAVIEKRLRPGERLNEAKLAEAFQLSRTRVRRVLNRLANENVVQFELNRGAFVSRPSVKEALDVYQARRFIEEAVIRILCQSANDDAIRRLRAYVEDESAAYEHEDSQVTRISGDFHTVLGELSGNRVLADLLYQLVQRCCIIQSLYERRPGFLCLTHEHRALIDLIEAGETERAIAAMEHHFDHIMENLELSPSREQEIDFYASLSRALPEADLESFR